MVRPQPVVQLYIKDAHVLWEDDRLRRAVGQSMTKLLQTLGAYTQQDARKSMRQVTRRPKLRVLPVVGAPDWFQDDTGTVISFESRPSRPGTPPRSILGAIKNFIRWQVQKIKGPDDDNVIIGPLLLPARGRNVRGSLPGPGLEEHGGGAITLQPFLAYSESENRVQLLHSWRPASYPQRPYMVPARDKQIRKLPQIIKAAFRPVGGI